VSAFSDADIRALVETGEFSDPRSAEWVADSLIKRRDKIAKAWFSKVLPIDKFSVVDGSLRFEHPGVGPDIETREYAVSWASQDANGAVTVLSGAVGTNVPAPRSDTRYLVATIHSPEDEALSVTVYLCLRQNRFEVLGVDR
jgi:hypothetical protein